MILIVRLGLLSGLCLLACCRSDSLQFLESLEWSNPQRIAILGSRGDTMEPFLSRDGGLLFFNNSNDPKVNTGVTGK